MIMKLDARTYTVVTALIVLIALPLLLYASGDVPRRTLLKESLSVLTLLCFSLMLSQFFMARSNTTLLKLFKPIQIQKVHKVIAYGAVGLMLLHPYLIVFPRYFESGVQPWDAFVTMVTQFDSLGILLGILAWVLMVVLVATAFFRRRLVKRFTHKYLGWRYFHSALAVTFTILVIWHAIDLGRHTNVAMSAYFILLAVAGIGLLARLYWLTPTKKKVLTARVQETQS